MASFTIAGFLAQIITGWGLNVDAVTAEVERIAAEFPDLGAQAAALEAWIHSQVSALESTAYNTVKGVAIDIIAGVAGVNPRAWTGSV